MNIKKIIAVGVMGASMLSLASNASAVIREVNIYGASAQYLYWKDQAANFLTAQGCYINGWSKQLDKKNMAAMGSCANGDKMILRVSAKASYDGPLALLGDTTDPNRGSLDPLNGCTDAKPFQRLMVDEASCTGASCTAKKCVNVTIGASDVEGTSFNQSSAGMKFGPSASSNNVWINRAFSPIDTSSLADIRKIVVPFAFFANNQVTKLNPATGLMEPVTNISRLQAAMIFSGQAWFWQDFDPSYTSLPVTACLRHAGSGTAATLDKSVMNPSWGATLVTAESPADPVVWFNDGSSDLMRCVDGIPGAIGYADADRAWGPGTSSPNTVRLAYNGVEANRATIRSGEYDNFWSVQNCYFNPTDTLAAVACNFVTNIPVTKAAFWAKTCEMNFMKASDGSYPTFQGATCAAP